MCGCREALSGAWHLSSAGRLGGESQVEGCISLCGIASVWQPAARLSPQLLSSALDPSGEFIALQVSFLVLPSLVQASSCKYRAVCQQFSLVMSFCPLP